MWVKFTSLILPMYLCRCHAPDIYSYFVRRNQCILLAQFDCLPSIIITYLINKPVRRYCIIFSALQYTDAKVCRHVRSTCYIGATLWHRFRFT